MTFYTQALQALLEKMEQHAVPWWDEMADHYDGRVVLLDSFEQFQAARREFTEPTAQRMPRFGQPISLPSITNLTGGRQQYTAITPTPFHPIRSALS